MVRRNIEMGMIENKKTLVRTFKNRKQGLLKKASELSKLCDVDTVVIVFGPNSNEPCVWPKEPEKLNEVITRFLGTSIEERRKKAKNLSSYINKVQEEYTQQDVINEPKNPSLDDQLDNLSVDQLVGLLNSLDCKIASVDERIGLMRNTELGCMNEYVQGVQSYGCEVQGMNMGIVPNSNFQQQYIQYPSVDGHGQFIDDDHKNAEIMMMLMMNGQEGFNPTEFYVSDCTGSSGVHNDTYSLEFDNQYYSPVGDQFFDDQTDAEIMMMTDMMTTNGEDCFNPTDLGVGDYSTELIGMEDQKFNHGGTWDAKPLSLYCDPFNELQQIALLNGAPL